MQLKGGEVVVKDEVVDLDTVSFLKFQIIM